MPPGELIVFFHLISVYFRHFVLGETVLLVLIKLLPHLPQFYLLEAQHHLFVDLDE